MTGNDRARGAQARDVGSAMMHLLAGDDPYPFYAELRSAEPLRWDAADAWLVGSYAGVSQVLADARFGVFDPGALMGIGREGGGRALEMMRQWLLFTDPPAHGRRRSLVQRAFTSQRVAALRGEIERLTERLVARLAGRDAIDVVADLATPLPLAVICGLLGVPEADAARLSAAGHDLARLLDPLPAPDVLARGAAAAELFDAYFRDRLGERRRRSQPDLLGTLVAASDDGGALDHSEILAFATLLFGAGSETTTHLIGSGLLNLLLHHDQMDLLRREPARVGAAIEEMLRFESPVQIAGRTARCDLRLGAARIRAGERVLLFLGAANRDATVFDEPDRFDVGRAAARHLAFSGGRHFCLGAQLARIEAATALLALVSLNPFSDWTMLALPYCNQDLYAGGGYTNAFPSITVERYRAVNLQAALRHLRDVLWRELDEGTEEGYRPDRLRVLFGGVSAGGFGVEYNYHYLLDDLRWANTTAVPDSALGLNNRSLIGVSGLGILMFGTGTAGWAGLPYRPPYCRGVNCAIVPERLRVTAPRLKATPWQQILSVSNQVDGTQRSTTRFSSSAAWTNAVRDSYCGLQGALGIRYFLPAGASSLHGMLQSDSRFASIRSDGVTLRDWLAAAMSDPDGVVDLVEEGSLATGSVAPFPCTVD